MKKLRLEYPRPDFQRDSFIPLNGEWDFSFDPQNKGHREQWWHDHDYDLKINVPFVPECEFSGIGDPHYHDHVWYRLKVKKPEIKAGQRLIIHFEGADYKTEVYWNGVLVETHIGSEGAFYADVTDYLKEDNELVVYCFDPGKDKSIPRGKQDWEEESHAIWYTRSTGIYKSVWMQIVDEAHVNDFYILTHIDDLTVSIDLEATVDEGEISFKVSDGQKEVTHAFEITRTKDTYTFALDHDFVSNRLWSIDNPFLFDLEITLKANGEIKDTVRSYFGIREIKTDGGRVLLNGKPIYQKLVLNQGYYPGGLLTAPSIEDFEKDIAYMKELGFNGCRIHQKVEDPYFLYLCDKHGFLIWQECPANYGFTSLSQRRLLNGWIEIVKNNFNHPSIIVYTPLNESWGVEGVPTHPQMQHFADALYNMIHSLDPSRLVISNDGWEQSQTDLMTVHNYNHGEKGDQAKYALYIEALSNRENLLRYGNIKRYIVNPGYEDKGQPAILSEFGGIAFKASKKENEKNWGYTTCEDGEDYVNELKRIYAPIQASKCLVGICYTQFTDVEQEVNGLITFDRQFKVDPAIIKALHDALIAF